jgi:transcriptional regulator of NAD metabolism
MKSEDRREQIVKYLDSQDKPVSGSRLASIFNVSRQVIVQDMAILRAEKINIIATSQGYMSIPKKKLFTKRVVCSHNKEDMKFELMTFIECGCKVIDVIVEHPVYGELKGNLMLSNSREGK